MNSKLIALITIIIVVILFVQKQGISNLVSSSFTKQTMDQLPNSTPNAPKQYNFDASTDLKKELDKINPQVLDSDFE